MSCPPCNHNCRQGRDCNCMPTPETACTWAVFGQVLLVAFAVFCIAVAVIHFVTT